MKKNQFALSLHTKPCAIIPNGCTPVFANIHTPHKVINIVYLGRIDVYHKGLDILLEGVKKISSYKRKININIYGFGSKKDEQIVKNLSTETGHVVHLHGPKYGLEKDKILRNADIIILTSRYEGFPMSILEGWSYGCPSIVTTGTNVSDIILMNNCGWVISSPTPQAVCETILKAVDDYTQNAAEYRSRALQTAITFAWPTIAAQSIEKYQSFL